MYVWQVYENAEWNILGAELGDLGHVPLVTTRHSSYELMRPLAVMHTERTGLPTRGVQYLDPIVMEAIEP